MASGPRAARAIERAPASAAAGAGALGDGPTDALAWMLARCVQQRSLAGRSADDTDEENPLPLAGRASGPPITDEISTGATATVMVQRNGGGAAAPTTMSIANVSGPTPRQCGAYRWRVNFRLPKASIAGGYFVQEVQCKRSATDCDGAAQPSCGYDLHYWEAWRVLAGGIQDEAVAAGRFTFADQYSDDSCGAGTKGTFDVVASVRFYEGLVLPPAFIPNNPGTQAGDLPSTANDPQLPGGTPALAHNIAGTWNCCPSTAAPTNTVITSHSP
jgi:hypothetical protein